MLTSQAYILKSSLELLLPRIKLYPVVFATPPYSRHRRTNLQILLGTIRLASLAWSINSRIINFVTLLWLKIQNCCQKKLSDLIH